MTRFDQPSSRSIFLKRCNANWAMLFTASQLGWSGGPILWNRFRYSLTSFCSIEFLKCFQ